jgi:hypothetical protein
MIKNKYHKELNQTHLLYAQTISFMSTNFSNNLILDNDNITNNDEINISNYTINPIDITNTNTTNTDITNTDTTNTDTTNTDTTNTDTTNTDITNTYTTNTDTTNTDTTNINTTNTDTTNTDTTNINKFVNNKIINSSQKYKIAILLRGHIRNSFNDNKLYNVIHKLVTLFNVDIYMHTWDENEAKVSWRPLSNKKIKITTELIEKYFYGVKNNIKKIIIDNDENIELFGSTYGNISDSIIPKIAWKRMWYGMNKVCNVAIQNNKYDLFISTRYDNADIILSVNIGYNINTIIDLINKFYEEKNMKNKNQIQFLKNSNDLGIDNFIMSNPSLMLLLCSRFFYNLDDVINSNPLTKYQEFLVYYEAIKINDLNCIKM